MGCIVAIGNPTEKAAGTPLCGQAYQGEKVPEEDPGRPFASFLPLDR